MQTSNKKLLGHVNLDVETLTQAINELNQLEKHLIQNWSTVHTTLYELLDGILKQHLTSLSCTAKPDIFIVFAGLQNHQAEAQLMVNKSTRVIIGAQFMRDTIFNLSAPNHPALIQQFNWILAHEVGHLHDNRFQILAKTHYPMLMLDITARFSLFYAIARFFLVTGSLEPRILIILAGVLTYFSLKHILLATYFRHLEYRADKFSLQCFDDLDLQNVHLVMSNITKNIASEINTMCKAASNASTFSHLSSWFMKASLLFSTFRRHPAVAKRINRLQALSK